MSALNPEDYIITRKRKKYKFALFSNHPLCFEVEEWAGQPKPHIVEVGAGTGLFAVELASQFPDRQVLAVDVKADRLITGAKEAAERGLTNIRFLRAHVNQLKELLTPHSVEKLWVTFPDPFPKTRYAKHRLTHPSFLEFYRSLLGADGALYFKTDAKPLFEWSLERLVEADWMLSELTFDLHESGLSDEYKLMTTYEKRYNNEGLKIHFVKAVPSK